MADESKSANGKEGGGGFEQARRIQEKLNLMQEATRSVKRSGRLMAVLIALVAIGGVYKLLSPFLEAYKNPAPYQKAIGVELEQKVLPALQDESQKLVNVFGPELYGTVSQKISDRLPEITTVVQAEALGLVQELSTEAESRLLERSDKMIDRLKTRLIEEVPEFGDDDQTETIMENVHQAATSAMDRFIQTYFQDHIHAVTNLQVRIETFPVPEHIKDMNDIELQDHLTDTLGAYVTHQLGSTMSPQMKEFLRTIETKQAQ